MPIVTAAIVAVGAAIATTTVATVATAAVALGTLVGTVGLGISVIGMATGNKTLTKIGGYLGMAGGAMGLAGGLAGGMAGYAKTLSTAWDDGVGSLFSSTKSVGQTPLGSVGNATAQKATAVQQSSVQSTSAAQPTTSIPPSSGSLGPRPQLLPSPSAGASNSLGTGGVNPLNSVVPTRPVVAGTDLSATQFANAAPKGAPLSTSNLSSITAQASQAPAAAQSVAAGVNAAAQPASGSGIGSFFSGLPDWAKAQVAISGAQGLAGMAGGWFEGATAEEKLALEREAQTWRMQHEDSIKNFNQKNASYAPMLSFGGNGMLSKGADQ
jgi:hypothetical protein